MKAFELFEKLMLRLFCGAECWAIHYRLVFKTGGYCEGIHRTYRSLSKETNISKKLGVELAEEIAGDFRFKTGIASNQCTIVSIQREW